MIKSNVAVFEEKCFLDEILQNFGQLWLNLVAVLLKNTLNSIKVIKDDYAKDGGPGEVWLLCSFYREPLRTWIKTNVNKFAISSLWN